MIAPTPRLAVSLARPPGPITSSSGWGATIRSSIRGRGGVSQTKRPSRPVRSEGSGAFIGRGRIAAAGAGGAAASQRDPPARPQMKQLDVWGSRQAQRPDQRVAIDRELRPVALRQLGAIGEVVALPVADHQRRSVFEEEVGAAAPEAALRMERDRE